MEVGQFTVQISRIDTMAIFTKVSLAASWFPQRLLSSYNSRHGLAFPDHLYTKALDKPKFTYHIRGINEGTT